MRSSKKSGSQRILPITDGDVAVRRVNSASRSVVTIDVLGLKVRDP